MHVLDLENKELQIKQKLEKYLVEQQNLSRKIKELDVELLRIKQQLKEERSKSLYVTEHAIQRFQQRILDIPRQRIKAVLSSSELYEKYMTHKAEKYRVKEVPGCIAVIKNHMVITVYASTDAEYRLMVLREYMDYYINCLIEKQTNSNLYIKPFRSFIKNFPTR